MARLGGDKEVSKRFNGNYASVVDVMDPSSHIGWCTKIVGEEFERWR
jgi:hypothetical protein